jgi:hypothetical protein
MEGQLKLKDSQGKIENQISTGKNIDAQEMLDHELAIKAQVLSGNQVQVRLRRISERVALAKQKVADEEKHDSKLANKRKNEANSLQRNSKNKKPASTPTPPPAKPKKSKAVEPEPSTSRSRIGESRVINFNGKNMKGTVVEPDPELSTNYEQEYPPSEPVVCFGNTLIKDHIYMVTQEVRTESSSSILECQDSGIQVSILFAGFWS